MQVWDSQSSDKFHTYSAAAAGALLKDGVVWSYTNSICTRRFEATLQTSTITFGHMLASWLTCAEQLLHEVPDSRADVAKTPAPRQRHLDNLVRCYVENIAKPNNISKSNNFLFKITESFEMFCFYKIITAKHTQHFYIYNTNLPLIHRLGQNWW